MSERVISHDARHTPSLVKFTALMASGLALAGCGPNSNSTSPTLSGPSSIDTSPATSATPYKTPDTQSSSPIIIAPPSSTVESTKPTSQGTLPITNPGDRDPTTLAELAGKFQANNWKVTSVGRYVISCTVSSIGHNTFTFTLNPGGRVDMQVTGDLGDGSIPFKNEHDAVIWASHYTATSCIQQ